MRYAALLIACVTPAVAQDLELALPIDCILGDTCYIQNYVDHDQSQAASDFQCGALTYDGHKGTDIGLPSLAVMEAGISVLASATGTVRGVRNDVPDVLYTPERADEIDGRECGNGVVIAHGGIDGGAWETQYCHMKQGSVVVQAGDAVTTGDVLGQVGLSGQTQFPHIHLSVRQSGAIVDPFDPDGSILCDEFPQDTLWSDPPETPAGGLIAIGFADHVPAYNAVKAGTAAAQSLAADSPIVLWAFAFGAQPGDTMSILFDGPNGTLFQTDDVLDRQQALVMRAGGLNPPPEGWPDGAYSGTVSHLRDGLVLDTQTTTISLP